MLFVLWLASVLSATVLGALGMSWLLSRRIAEAEQEATRARRDARRAQNRLVWALRREPVSGKERER